MTLAMDIWEACPHLSADYLSADEIGADYLYSLCKARRISWVIILRSNDMKSSGLVRIKNAARKIDMEVTRTEVADTLNSLSNNSVGSELTRVRTFSSSSSFSLDNRSKSFENNGSLPSISITSLIPLNSKLQKNPKKIDSKGIRLLLISQLPENLKNYLLIFHPLLLAAPFKFLH